MKQGPPGLLGKIVGVGLILWLAASGVLDVTSIFGGVAEKLPQAYPPASGLDAATRIAQLLGLGVAALPRRLTPVSRPVGAWVWVSVAVLASLALPYLYRKVPDWLGASGLLAAVAPLGVVFLAFFLAGWLCRLAGLAVERTLFAAWRKAREMFGR